MKSFITSLFVFSITIFSNAQSSICLSPNATLTTGSGPRSMVTGLFNNDGFLDIIVANHGIASNIVSVFMGNGNGTFAAATTYTMGSNPRITKGDFNNDGFLDIATANESGINAELTVRLNNGNGTFGAMATYSAGSNPGFNMPLCITSKDFNNDGRSDLALINMNGAGLSVFLAGPSGTFAPCVNYTLSSNGQIILSEHFNNDANYDLVISNSAGIHVLLGSPSGTFSPSTFYSKPNNYFIAAGNFNNDAYNDIATNEGILLGSSNGSFTAAGNYTITGGWGIAASDFDGNGTTDLAINTSTNSIILIEGLGNGNFGPQKVINSIAYGAEMITGDFNADGKPDLAAGNGVGSAVEVYQNNSFLFNVSANPTFSCNAFNSTLTAFSSVNNYSWSVGGTNSNAIVNASVSTVYSVSSTNSVGCVATLTLALTINTPTFQLIASSNSVCAGSNVTLSASGMTSYTWNNGPSTASLLVNPLVNTTYSVSGTNSAGCISNQTIAISILPNPNLSISSASSSICLGSSINLSANGANSYTWNGGQTSTSIVVTPTTNTCYTLSGTDLNGCITFTTSCISVLAPPVLFINASANTVCANSTLTLVANGALTYTWSNNQITSLAVVAPSANTCYTVIGTDANGCNSSASVCVNTFPVSTLTVMGSSNLVCLGTSANLIASGSNSYTWSTGANISTVNVLPTATTVYSVFGLDENSCVSIGLYTLYVNQNCSDVWPGDANSDGIVNGTDIIELGISYLSSGPPRAIVNNVYTGQYCANWTGTVSTGKNKNHADCNGDGTVNLSDTLAVYSNFSLSHGFRLAASSSSIQLHLIPEYPNFILPGQWNTIKILIADSVAPITLLGLVFDLDYINSIIEQDSLYLSYSPSFLNSDAQNIEFRKTAFLNQKIHAADVKTNFMEVSGYGEIARFHFKAKSNLIDNIAYTFNLSQAVLTRSDLSTESISANSLSLTVNSNVLALSAFSNTQNIRLYPNPASNYFILKNTSNSKANYSLIDMSGRLVSEGNFEGSISISTEGLANGLYTVICKSQNSHNYFKLVLQK